MFILLLFINNKYIYEFLIKPYNFLFSSFTLCSVAGPFPCVFPQFVLPFLPSLPAFSYDVVVVALPPPTTNHFH